MKPFVNFLPNQYLEKINFPLPKKLYYTVNQLLFYLPQKAWTLYDKSCAVTKISPVAFTTFADLWLKLLSHIKVGKPTSDLCWVGQKNSTLLTRLMNESEDEKSEVSTLKLRNNSITYHHTHSR